MSPSECSASRGKSYRLMRRPSASENRSKAERPRSSVRPFGFSGIAAVLAHSSRRLESSRSARMAQTSVAPSGRKSEDLPPRVTRRILPWRTLLT